MSGKASDIAVRGCTAYFIPVQTRLTEPTGDYTTVRFEQVVINGPLAAKAFELTLPKDVVEVK